MARRFDFRRSCQFQSATDMFLESESADFDALNLIEPADSS